MRIFSNQNTQTVNKVFTLSILSAAVLTSGIVLAADISFDNIATDTSSGLNNYMVTPRTHSVTWDDFYQSGNVLTMMQNAVMPFKSQGAPGVAIFDYDNDGDEDIYVSNGPGSHNGLFKNQLTETGSLTFVNVSEMSMAGAMGHDSSGVCYGDVDNDGDKDLLVLGIESNNIFYENMGDGSFMDKTIASGLGGNESPSMTCSMGDINSDGFLDIVISNTWTGWTDQLPLATFDNDHRLVHNQLFVNQRNGKFIDEAKERGLHDKNGISWAIALVDYDQDGDVDVIVGDDQGPRAPANVGGEDRGFISIYRNQNGNFTNITHDIGLNEFGAFMSLSFGDFNSDGTLDIFSPNIGEYLAIFTAPLLFPVTPEEWASTTYVQDANGMFTKQPVSEDLGATPFGWGSSATDYDNDGDIDVIFHGGEHMGSFIDASNPGTIYENDGMGIFSYDSALANSADHSRRNVEGLASGDLNNDGFPDYVSVSSFNWPSSAPLIPYLPEELGSPFDSVSMVAPSFIPVNGDPMQGFIWSGIELDQGDVTVDINSGNDNHYLKVKLMGMKGVTSFGKVNRDAQGAVISVQPLFGDSISSPVLTGGSYASSHSLIKTFGLGNGFAQTVEVLWPGGNRFKHYFASVDDVTVIPEIPCSYSDPSFSTYRRCVNSALLEMTDEGVINLNDFATLSFSAYYAWLENASM